MRRFFLLILAILLCSGLGAQQIAQRSFAIFVDKATAQACRAELEAYRDVITAEGLPAEILAGDWATPEQVRDRIRQLDRDKGLEGAVFVGDDGPRRPALHLGLQNGPEAVPDVRLERAFRPLLR